MKILHDLFELDQNSRILMITSARCNVLNVDVGWAQRYYQKMINFAKFV